MKLLWQDSLADFTVFHTNAKVLCLIISITGTILTATELQKFPAMKVLCYTVSHINYMNHLCLWHITITYTQTIYVLYDFADT